jgi:hypothetical protein
MPTCRHALRASSARRRKAGGGEMMKLRGLAVALVLACAAASPSMAQSSIGELQDAPSAPKLGDIMNAAQTRHIKLWYAAKAANWDLAKFGLHQLRASLVEAAMLYSGIPVTNVTTLLPALQSIADAIDAKDGQRFTKAYGELTAGCNACHQSMERSFIVIRTPTEQPFGDQVFAPQGKK